MKFHDNFLIIDSFNRLYGRFDRSTTTDITSKSFLHLGHQKSSRRFSGHLAHLNESETNRATYLIKERRSQAYDSINLGKEWIEVVNSLLFRVAVESDKFTVSRRYEILFLRLKMII